MSRQGKIILSSKVGKFTVSAPVVGETATVECLCAILLKPLDDILVSVLLETLKDNHK